MKMEKELKNLVIWILDPKREDDIHSLIINAEKNIKSLFIKDAALALSNNQQDFEKIQSQLNSGLS